MTEHIVLGGELLSFFELRPFIDYVKIETPGKMDLPPLASRPEWGIADGYRTLTLHDYDPKDFPDLPEVLRTARVRAVEVGVDAYPASFVRDVAQRRALIDQLHGWVARHLYPMQAPHMEDAPAIGWVPQLRKLMPFNFRATAPDETLYFNWRGQPAQVKVYVKGRDNNEALPERMRRVRIEVTLQQGPCEDFGLRTLADLRTFRFRKHLMPYFRFVSHPRALPPRVNLRRGRELMLMLAAKKASIRQAGLEDQWSRTGVRGCEHETETRFHRHPKVNQRIGWALQRLERRLAAARI